MGGERAYERARWPARPSAWRSKMGAFLRRYGVPLGIVALCLLGTVLAYPYLSALWHLEVGGRALDVALGEIDPLNWWYVGPMAVQDSQALQTAVEHLEKATRHSFALRLLGRAHAAQGDLLAAIQALERFTALRPDNAAGHLELAAAYAWADRRLQGMVSVSLLETLPGATVSAPDLPGETHYQPEGWRSDYAYPTAFLLPSDEDKRPTLFLHAGSQVTYTLSLTQPAVLSFGMGLDPRSLGWGGDGVTFEVFVDGTRVFLEHLTVETARGGWQERQVDLSAYAGQTVALSLASTPGPVGDVTADWAGWGDPRVEVPEAAIYRRAVRGEPWLDQWAEAGVMAEDLANAGEGARKTERYGEALTWYEYAMRQDPDLGDPWYYLGLLYEDQEQWEDALAAYQRAIASGRLGQVHRSSPYYRLGTLFQWRLGEQRLDNALAAYEAAIDANHFRSDWEAAECHYRRGEILRWQEAELDDYISEFRQAIALNPQHGPAHLALGVSIYKRDQDGAAAEVEILKALDLAPQHRWAYYYLGEIYREEGHMDEAAAMYKQALEIDPAFKEAR
jgi:tetratricopeptide (TPR) repeat protein